MDFLWLVVLFPWWLGYACCHCLCCFRGHLNKRPCFLFANFKIIETWNSHYTDFFLGLAEDKVLVLNSLEECLGKFYPCRALIVVHQMLYESVLSWKLLCVWMNIMKQFNFKSWVFFIKRWYKLFLANATKSKNLNVVVACLLYHILEQKLWKWLQVARCYFWGTLAEIICTTQMCEYLQPEGKTWSYLH